MAPKTKVGQKFKAENGRVYQVIPDLVLTLHPDGPSCVGCVFDMRADQKPFKACCSAEIRRVGLFHNYDWHYCETGTIFIDVTPENEGHFQHVGNV